MRTRRRETVYLAQTGRRELTPRQLRRIKRKSGHHTALRWREMIRDNDAAAAVASIEHEPYRFALTDWQRHVLTHVFAPSGATPLGVIMPRGNGRRMLSQAIREHAGRGFNSDRVIIDEAVQS